MDNVSTEKKNTIATKRKNTIETNVMSTGSINCHSRKARDCYILHTGLLVIILLSIIAIICYHYAKQKMCNIKCEIMNLKKFVLKIVRGVMSIT